MFKIKFEGLKDLQNNVDDLIKHRIPMITALTLTATAKGLKAHIESKLPSIFDRPTRWTLNSLYFMSASPKDLNAYVWFKDETSVAKGTPASKYLWPEVHGGPRNLKRFEKALVAIGVLPPGMSIVPGSAAKIDAFGNLDRGQIIQILSYFRAFPEAGYRANITDKRKATLAKGSKRTNYAGVVYFVGRPGADGVPRRGRDFQAAKSPMGIWARYQWGAKGARQGAVKPIMIFVKSAPQYSVRLPFYTWAEEYVNRELPRNWDRIAAETLAYWRSK